MRDIAFIVDDTFRRLGKHYRPGHHAQWKELQGTGGVAAGIFFARAGSSV